MGLAEIKHIMSGLLGPGLVASLNAWLLLVKQREAAVRALRANCWVGWLVNGVREKG